MTENLYEVSEKRNVTRKIPIDKIEALTYSDTDDKELIIHI